MSKRLVSGFKSTQSASAPNLTGEMAEVITAAKRLCDRLGDEGMIDYDQLRYSIMSRNDRKAIAKDLSAQGVSARQIAKVTGVDQRTIRRDNAAANAAPAAANAAPTPASKPAPKPATRADVMPTEEEADKSYQDTLFDLACDNVREMDKATRARFFAHLEEKYHAVKKSKGA